MKGKSRTTKHLNRKSLITSDLECIVCKKTFQYESEKIRHELSHSKKFQCKLCAKNFSFISALKRHEKQHSRSMRVKCELCNKYFLDSALLERHLKYSHKGQYDCEVCSSSFKSETALNTHSLSHTSASDRKYQCSIVGCGKRFNFVHHLKKHELMHKNEKKYFCHVCFKGFIQSQHLKSHLNIHDPASWVSCTHPGCTKRFATEYTMKRHLARHKEPGRTVAKTNFSTSKNYLTGEQHKRSIENNNEQNMCKNYTEIEILNNEIEDDKKVEADNGNEGKNSTIDREISKTSDCRTVIGDCINGDDNCFCDEINSVNKATITNTNTNIENLEIFKKGNILKNNTDCACGSKPDQPFKPTCKDSMPSLEIRPDGVIKLIDTYDINIVTIEDRLDKGNIVREEPVPMNSCKEVLGNCIVSVDGTVGEGCLCARMSADTHNVMDEETAMGVFDS